MMIEKIKPIRLGVLASGRGSNLEAILKNIENGTCNARVVAVLSNVSTAGALVIAGQHNIPAFHISQKQFPGEQEFVNRLLSVLDEHAIDLIILAGYLKKVPADVIRHYRNKILNIHPALLPAFGGHGLYGHFVHEAVLAFGCKVSGATVHIVDEEFDSGVPVIQKCVPVLDDDTPETLASRVLEVEHKIYSQAIQLFAEDKIRIDGRTVRILNK
jgi:phosphoribosylglycinamide formyltransferase 1